MLACMWLSSQMAMWEEGYRVQDVTQQLDILQQLDTVEWLYIAMCTKRFILWYTEVRQMYAVINSLACYTTAQKYTDYIHVACIHIYLVIFVEILVAVIHT